MKTLISALVLSALTSPVLAVTLPAGVSVDSLNPANEVLGRRSGRCPREAEQIVVDGQIVGREGSTCGGV